MERTHQQSIERAAAVIANGLQTCAQKTPREQAEGAYTPDGPSVDELEDRIRARRGMTPLDRGGEDRG